MNKYLVVSKVDRGFIVSFKFGDNVKATAVYTSLQGEEFGLDVEAYFKEPTAAELKKMEKRAKEPVV
jgi:hypothetical protein